MLGDHGMYTKSVMYDPSVRVPLIISGPGIEPGQTSDAMVELIDLNPTICELAGVPVLEGTDSESLVDVFRNGKKEHRDVVVSELHNCRMARSRDYKLVSNINDSAELYDMKNDPDEVNNLIDSQPELARPLGKALNQRFMANKWHR